MTRFFLRGRSEDRLGQAVALFETSGKLDAAHGPRLLVFLPARARQIATDDAFDRHDFRFLHDHAPTDEALAVDSGRQRQRVEIHGEEMVRDVEAAEPHFAQFGEDAALIGDAIGQHPVERADAVAGDKQQPVAEVIHVADLAAPHRNTGDFATKQNRPCHHISLIVGRTSKGSLWWKPVPASTVVGQAASLPLLQIRTERNCPSGTPPSLRFRLEAFANSHTRNGKLAARPTFKMAIQQLAPRTNAG